MPSLNVPCVAAMNSCSLMSSRRWKVTSVGIVASPTPTVPISSDSISLMSSTLPSIFDRHAATIQPAVPPPAMTTLLINFCSTSIPSAIQSLQQSCSQLPRRFGIQRPKDAARLPRNVSSCALLRLEDVVPEQVLPGLALLRRQVAHSQDREHERVHGRVHERRRLAPPVVHQHVQGLERLDVMPPHAGNEDRIARAELGDLRVRQRCRELREFCEIRLREIDQADRLACGREIEWTDVEVLQLFGREQREAAAPRNDACDVIRQIVMGGDARAIAQPDAYERLAIAESEIVLGAKTRQARVERRGPDIDCRRNLRLALARD